MPLPRGIPSAAQQESQGDSEGLREGQVVVVGILALQQAAVGGDLLFQSRLDVQQHLVLLVLALHLTAELAQLGLDAADEALDLLQLRGVAALRLCQRALQPGFLVGSRPETPHQASQEALEGLGRQAKWIAWKLPRRELGNANA